MRKAKLIDVPKLPLELRRESLRNLTPDQLTHAVGGVNGFRSSGCRM